MGIPAADEVHHLPLFGMPFVASTTKNPLELVGSRAATLLRGDTDGDG